MRKNNDFTNKLKSKVRIEDRRQLISIMIIEALAKGFLEFDSERMKAYTTFRNLFDEVKEKYNIPERFE